MTYNRLILWPSEEATLKVDQELADKNGRRGARTYFAIITYAFGFLYSAALLGFNFVDNDPWLLKGINLFFIAISLIGLYTNVKGTPNRPEDIYWLGLLGSLHLFSVAHTGMQFYQLVPLYMFFLYILLPTRRALTAALPIMVGAVWALGYHNDYQFSATDLRAIAVAWSIFVLIHVFYSYATVIAFDLILARERSEALESRRQYIRHITHEFRTPLAAVSTTLQTAKFHPSDEALRERLQEQTQQLEWLVTRAADFQDSKDNCLEVKLEGAKVRDFIRDFQREYRTPEDKANIGWSISVSPKVDEAMVWDWGLLRKALRCLIDNAFKFTPDGGHIKLSVRLAAADKVAFEVYNSGDGFSAKDTNDLFEAFAGLEGAADNRSSRGLGLGLYLAKTYIDHQGGQLSLLKSDLKGCLFQILLPRTPYDTDQQGQVNVVDFVENARQQTFSDEKPLKGKRILVVDDMPVNLFVSGEMLNNFGATVETAESGLLALEAVRQANGKQRPFDLILMDLQMPEMDGFECTQQIRSEFPTVGTPIVAYTATHYTETSEQAVRTRFDAFLRKGEKAKDMIRSLVTVIANSQQRRYGT